MNCLTYALRKWWFVGGYLLVRRSQFSRVFNLKSWHQIMISDSNCTARLREMRRPGFRKSGRGVSGNPESNAAAATG